MEGQSLWERITDNRELANNSGRENLALIASHFICHRLGVTCPPHDSTDFSQQPEYPPVRKLADFLSDMLRCTQLVDDVLFGALMIIERTRNIRPHFFRINPQEVVSVGKLVFLPAYIIAADVMAGITVSKIPSYNILLPMDRHWIDSRTKIWTSARTFEIDFMMEATEMQAHEGWMLDILNDDTSLDKKMLAMFKKNVAKDFGNDSQRPFPSYPRSFVTNRPVFLHKRSRA